MRSNKRYSLEFKLSVLKRIDDKHSIESISRELEIRRSIIEIDQWKSLFDDHGIDGISRKRKKHRYTNEFKEKVLKEHIQNKTSFRSLGCK